MSRCRGRLPTGRVPPHWQSPLQPKYGVFPLARLVAGAGRTFGDGVAARALALAAAMRRLEAVIDGVRSAGIRGTAAEAVAGAATERDGSRLAIAHAVDQLSAATGSFAGAAAVRGPAAVAVRQKEGVRALTIPSHRSPRSDPNRTAPRSAMQQQRCPSPPHG